MAYGVAEYLPERAINLLFLQHILFILTPRD